MTTNPQAKRVLFYGDSFVYGKMPGANRRWPADVRFTGRLQAALGSSIEIIEEGLRARMLTGTNQFFPERDGLEQFGPIIGSHLPVDLLVIFLGTNDCNAGSQKSDAEVAQALKDYSAKLQSWAEFLAAPRPKILVLAPPNIDPSLFDDAMKPIFDGAPAKLEAMRSGLQAGAAAIGADFMPTAEVCAPGRSPHGADGIHLDEAGNAALAAALAPKIKALLSV